MTNLVAVLVPYTRLLVEGHVEIPVEEPDLLGAGEGVQEAVLLSGHVTGLVLAPAKLPLLLPALSDGVTIGHTLQVGIYPKYKISENDICHLSRSHTHGFPSSGLYIHCDQAFTASSLHPLCPMEQAQLMALLLSLVSMWVSVARGTEPSLVYRPVTRPRV